MGLRLLARHQHARVVGHAPRLKRICRPLANLIKLVLRSRRKPSSMMITILSSVFVLWQLLGVLVSSSALQESGIPTEYANTLGPVVDLGYAKYQGSIDLSTNISSFLSIRYAAPPIGEPIMLLSLILQQPHTCNVQGSLRFQAPQAPARMNDVQTATSPPPQCYQASGGTSQTNPYVHNRSRSEKRYSSRTSEDCLFLEQVFNPFAILIAENKILPKCIRSRHRDG